MPARRYRYTAPPCTFVDCFGRGCRRRSRHISARCIQHQGVGTLPTMRLMRDKLGNPMEAR